MNIRIRIFETGSRVKVVSNVCFKDICDCDTDAKDNCEDCECGLAWVSNGPEKVIFDLPTEYNNIVVVDERR